MSSSYLDCVHERMEQAADMMLEGDPASEYVQRLALEVKSLAKAVRAWDRMVEGDGTFPDFKAAYKEHFSQEPLASTQTLIISKSIKAARLEERLQAIIDWADIALKNPHEFNSHGVRNLSGPIFDLARLELGLEP